MPSLVDIITDLEECAHYQSHDINTAFRFLEDLRKDVLALALHVKQHEVELGRQQPDAE
jgi:hypothetical protein